MKIYSLDRCKLKFNPEQIFNVLTDFQRYPEWWPKIIHFKNFKIINGTQKIYVKPVFASGFLWEMTNISKYGKIVISYADGAYKGTGTWRIYPQNGKTNISYEIHLKINDKFTLALSKFINIEKMHSKMMLVVFKKLEKHLDTLIN